MPCTLITSASRLIRGSWLATRDFPVSRSGRPWRFWDAAWMRLLGECIQSAPAPHLYPHEDSRRIALMTAQAAGPLLLAAIALALPLTRGALEHAGTRSFMVRSSASQPLAVPASD